VPMDPARPPLRPTVPAGKTDRQEMVAAERGAALAVGSEARGNLADPETTRYVIDRSRLESFDDVDLSNYPPRVQRAARGAITSSPLAEPFGSDVLRSNKWGNRTLGDLVARGGWEEGRSPVTLLHRATIRAADLEQFLHARMLSDYTPTKEFPFGGHWTGVVREGFTWDVTVKGPRTGNWTAEIYKVERGTKFWLDRTGMFVPERRLIPFEPRRSDGQHSGGSFLRGEPADVKMAQTTTTQSPAVSVVAWVIPASWGKKDEMPSGDLPPAHQPGDSDLTLFFPNKKPNTKNPRQKKSREPKKGNDGVDGTKPTEITFDS
jgi:hypothetical protein